MPKLDKNESLSKIKNECSVRHLSFLGVKNGEWLGTRTKLLLHCNKCGFEWDSTTYQNFIKHGVGCLRCNKLARITEKDVLIAILKRCNDEGFVFNGFVNGDGKDTKYSSTKTHFKITCSKCHYSWITTYEKFIREKHGCLGCTKYARLNFDKALEMISDGINEAFLCNKNGNVVSNWNGIHNTYVHFKCKECNSVSISTFNNFVNRKHKCLNCYEQSLSSIKLSSRNDHVHQKVNAICEKLGYSFNGFCNSTGKDSDFIGVHETYLNLHCNRCGNSWNTCNVSNFLKGRMCPKCRHWRLEDTIKELLKANNIEFKENVRPIWLNGLELDFFLPNLNIGIECQGLQHFKSIPYWGGDKMLNVRMKNDKKKFELCEKNDIKLFYYSNLGIDYPYKVFEDKEKLLEEIMKCEEIDE